MKTKKMNLKAIVLSLGLAAMMLPANAMAQGTSKRPGGLFGFNDLFATEGLFQNRSENRNWISRWKSNFSKNPLHWVAVSSFYLARASAMLH